MALLIAKPFFVSGGFNKVFNLIFRSRRHQSRLLSQQRPTPAFWSKTACFQYAPPNTRLKPQTPPREKFEPRKVKYRRQGTGSIHQVSKNVWEGRYSPNINGKRIIRNVYAGSIEECEQKLAQMIATMNAEIAEMKMAIHA